MSFPATTILSIIAYQQEGSLHTNRPGPEQSFSLQYTSLILIVLTFVLGAFVRDPQALTAEKEEIKLVAVLPAALAGDPAPQLLAELKYTDLFELLDSELNNAKTGALQEFLRSHDVNAELEIYSDSAEKELTRDQHMSLALARSVTLSQYLIKAGVPPSAISSFAYDRSSELQARIKLYRVGAENG